MKIQSSKIFFLLILFLLPLKPVFGQTNAYPKLANYFLGWEIKPTETNNLAKWDLLVLDMEVQENSLLELRKIRQLNPDIKILAYISSEEANPNPNSDYANLRKKLAAGIADDWWLKDATGNWLSFWEGTYVLNPNSGWADYLVNFVNDEIMSTGLWDGVFYDNLWGTISWLNNGKIDINNDGHNETEAELDNTWAKSVKTIITKTNQKLPQAKVVGNGTMYLPFQSYINGLMFEGFPSPWENGGTWQGNMQSISKSWLLNKEPKLSILNVYKKNQYDYQAMRFGLGSALLQNSYFSFDYDISDHSQTWWYDEYEANIGLAETPAYNLFKKSDQSFSASLWRRDYTNAIVVVNSSNQEQKYSFPKEEFERLDGTQDRNINNGSLVNWVKLKSKDAIILLKRRTIIRNSSFSNGSFIRVFKQSGEQSQNGFFAYFDAYPGSSQVLISDLDNDQNDEYLVNNDGWISVYSQGRLKTQFKPYDGRFKGDISIAVADLDNNGTKEIVTGAGSGGGPHIRIFSKDGKLLNGGFFAYNKNFRGGVNIAILDLNGDGTKEIVTGAGSGGGPHIRIFSKEGNPVNGGFFAFDQSFSGGVNVAVGNVNQDSQKEIIVCPNQGGGGEIKIFSKDGKFLKSFFPYQDFDGQLKVLADDLDNDGIDEILSSTLDF
jgi:hypothetical protein